jgi:hypothetical protein
MTAPPTTDRAMLDAVYRRLVGIHASVAESTNDDPGIVPWTERELRTLVRELGAFRKAKRAVPSREPDAQ